MLERRAVLLLCIFMVTTCHYCLRQPSGPRPIKKLRHHYSIWEPEDEGKKKAFYVCGDPECEQLARNDKSFMPSVIEEHLKEWVTFVFVRGSLTDWSTSGVTMDESIMALRTRLGGDAARILEGLAELKKHQACRNAKIYDPFFRDPCSQRAVIELKLLFAKCNWPGVWFMAVASTMRLNRNLVGNYVDLWEARTKTAAKAVLEKCVDKSSITQLGNPKFEVYKKDLLNLWEDSQVIGWKREAERCVQSLVEGTSFQDVIRDWKPKRRPSGTECKNPEHFRAYFVGKLLHRANCKCSYVEFPGGTLVRKGASTGKVLLADLLYGLDVGLDGLSKEQRSRWWSGVAQRFRDLAGSLYPGLFGDMEDGEIEHSGCEFVRFYRKLQNRQCAANMLPSIQQIFENVAQTADSSSDSDSD